MEMAGFGKGSFFVGLSLGASWVIVVWMSSWSLIVVARFELKDSASLLVHFVLILGAWFL